MSNTESLRVFSVRNWPVKLYTIKVESSKLYSTTQGTGSSEITAFRYSSTTCEMCLLQLKVKRHCPSIEFSRETDLLFCMISISGDDL